MPLGKALSTLLAISQSEFDYLIQEEPKMTSSANHKINQASAQALKSFEDAFQCEEPSPHDDARDTISSLLGEYMCHS